MRIDLFEVFQRESWNHAENAGFHASRADLPEHFRRIVVCGLIGTEASEALEAARNGNNENYMEELADVVIRCMDEAEHIVRIGTYNGLSLSEMIAHKQAVNRERDPLHGKLT